MNRIQGFRRRVLSLLLCACISGCGDGVTDLSYRGTALFEFEGQVQVRGQFARGEHHIRLSIFWLPSGGATAKEDWIEQTSTSVAIDFPSSFRVRIFEPPKASHFYSVAAVGRLMLYDDLNKNRQWDKDEPFVGGSEHQGIVYGRHNPEGIFSFLGLNFSTGFNLVHFPLRCHSRLDQRRDLTCRINVGGQCETSDDCCLDAFDCAGRFPVCLTSLDNSLNFPGGYCSTRNGTPACETTERQPAEAEVAARPVAFKLLQIQTAGELVLKTCNEDEQCRDGYVCEPAYLVCLPKRPVILELDPDYTIGRICESEDGILVQPAGN